MQEKRPLSQREIKTIENTMRERGIPEEVILLVCDDYRFGLSKEETDQYLIKSFTLEQMRIYSKALRKDVPKEVLEMFRKPGVSAQKMAIILEFYEKGVPVDTIQSALSEELTPHAFSLALRRIQEVMAGMVPDGQREHVDMLLSQLKGVMESIEKQGKRYELLTEKLEQFGTRQLAASQDEAFMKEMEGKNKLIEAQKEEISKAQTSLARLREEIDELKRAVNIPSSTKQEGKDGGDGRGKADMNVNAAHGRGSEERPPAWAAYLLAPDGGTSGPVLLEEVKTAKNREHGAFGMLLSRFVHRKKLDIVRLVTEHGLSAGQLIQIRRAIEKGLTDEQIRLLIERKPLEEQMEEIIQIAIYENNREE